MLLRAFWLLLLIGVNSAHAGVFDDQEARRQIAAQQALIGDVRNQGQALETRVIKLEETLSAQPLLDLHSQIQTLRLDLNRLQGQIEVLVNENELTQKRQKDFYIDLDTRLRRIEQPDEQGASQPAKPESDGPEAGAAESGASSGTLAPTAQEPGAAAGSAMAAVSPASAPAGPNGANLADSSESRVYEAGFTLFKAGRYNDAISHFNKFIKDYPDSNLTPSAQYWIGNSHYALRDFKNAISAQEKLIGAFPDSAKAPDAMLNIASSQQEMNRKPAARKTLQGIIAKYPGSDAAEKAKQRLANVR
ncbi:tol-pal system protein YbgF [Nitrosospira briensis]|uniref:Cell division coordinator CpoB n=1 Tax=Nitrosospira briensis TaxID=35799 RepID=A0A1I5ENK0_9PROT|nr:tol-pal system protein YbgF [Nitrosospira briensis]SFO12926.1 tol-pal system protein YbgF [Nitrosospira briensis]